MACLGCPNSGCPECDEPLEANCDPDGNATYNACEDLVDNIYEAIMCRAANCGTLPTGQELAELICAFNKPVSEGGCVPNNESPQTCWEILSCLGGAGIDLSPGLIAGLMSCMSCDLCDPIENCQVGTPPDCDVNGDGSVDCADLQLLREIEEVCAALNNCPPASEQRLVDLACSFYTQCNGSSTSCGSVVACLLSMERFPSSGICEVIACSGCTQTCVAPQEECDLVEMIGFDAGMCDIDGDGQSTAKDFEVIMHLALCCAAEACLEGPPTAQEVVDLICAFSTACGGCVNVDELIGRARSLGYSLNHDETQALVDCLACGAPVNDPTTDPGAGAEETDGDSSEDNTGSCGEGGDAGGTSSTGNAKVMPVGGGPSERPREPRAPQVGGQRHGTMDVPQSISPHPVSLATGHKLEFATDLVVQLPDTSFALTRAYTSSPDYTGASLADTNWMLSSFRFLVEDSGNNELIVFGPSPREKRIYKDPHLTGKWTTTGLTTQSIELVTGLTINGIGCDVWRLSTPGERDVEFVAASMTHSHLVGLIIRARDIYGRADIYEYIEVGPSMSAQPRLSAIHLGINEADSETIDDADASVIFHWNLNSSAAGSLGKIKSVEVLRRNLASIEVVTDRVQYHYIDGTVDQVVHAETGTLGDLVQVTKSTLLNTDNGPARYWTSVTQYRYHNGTEPTNPNSEERLDVNGDEHQLKMVINPEQIEYAAQQTAAFHSGVDPSEQVARFATQLLAMADSDELGFIEGGSNAIVADLAAKIVGYDYGIAENVKRQYVQSACGCSGPVQAVRFDYSYFSLGADRSTRADQYVDNGSGYALHRTLIYDLEYINSGNVPYLVTEAVIEDSNPDGADRQWVVHYEYDGNNIITKKFTPAALNTYTPFVTGTPGTASQYTPHNSQGLVYSFVHDGNNRFTELRMGQGGSGSYNGSNYQLISRATYNSTRPWLVESVEEFRTTTSDGSVPADDVELTTFAYGFHSVAGDLTDRIAWIKTSVEGELVSENGAAATYETFQLVDTNGMTTWTRSEDNTLIYREYDTASGALNMIVRNADPVARSLPGTYAGQTTTYWGLIQGTSTRLPGGELVTTFVNDLMGRTLKRTEPGNVHSYTVRTVRQAHERPGMNYYAVLHLPHQLAANTDSFDGTARVSLRSAGGSVIQSIEHTVNGARPYGPVAGTFFFDNIGGTAMETARSTVQHTLAGLVKSSRSWHRIDPGAYLTGVYEDTFTYDGLGRVLESTNDNGTITRYETYDDLDRVLEVQVGTSSMNMTTVAEYVYDDPNTGDGRDQLMGNGNMTSAIVHTGEGPLGNAQRITDRVYDWRDRLIKVLAPELPHQAIEYDNLDRVTRSAVFKAVPSSVDAPLTDRGMLSVTSYSQRGLTWRSQIAMDPTDSSPDFLETHMWYDPVGRTIASWGPNAPGAKVQYDAHSRPMKSFVTDRGGDDAPGTSDTLLDAGNVTDDVVLEQTEYTYTASGLVDFVTHRTGNLNAGGSATDELDSGDSVASYIGTLYDAAKRRIRTVNYGTNHSSDIFAYASAPSWPPVGVPDWDTSGFEDQIISAMEYDDRGRIASVIDAKGRVTVQVYDDLDRRVAVVENFDDADVTWDDLLGRWTVAGLDDAEPDNDRVTSYVYDGSGNVVQQIAHLPDGTNEKVQVTQYEYGTTVGANSSSENSLVASKDLLREVWYPDELNGTPGSTDEYKVRYAYNALGELRSIKDQNFTVHEYERDPLGRITQDTVSSFGTNIDSRIEAVSVSYDDFGRVDAVKSLGTASAVLNHVAFAYTPLWQIESVEQDVDSAIGGSGIAAQTVGYTYLDTPSNNSSVLEKLVYPDSTQLGYSYGSSSSLNSVISRIGAMSVSGTPIANYDYLGLEMFAGVDYPVPDIQLDRTLSTDGKRRLAGHTTQSAGLYPGWDRFGRVKYHTWVDGNLTTGSGSRPDRPQLFAESYAYDNASNRTARYDDVPRFTGTWVSRDWQFRYDGLDRLTESLRGTWNAGTSTFNLNKGSQKWNLDMLGNWNGFQEDRVAGAGWGTTNPTYGDTGDLDETRDHNEANELIQIDTPTPVRPLAYDDAGNMTEYLQLGGTVRRKYIHDAWNRLVKVENRNASSGALIGTLAEYEYNGLHWRTVKRADTDQVPDNAIDQQRVMYYNAGWQLIEEHVDDAYNAGIGHVTNRIAQNFWGLRYIDDAVMRRVNDVGTGAAGTYEGTWYYVTDVQFSVRSLIRPNGVVEESIEYDPYGKALYHDPSDFDGDGTAGGSLDFNAFTVAYAAPHRSSDFNRDGTIGNSSDYFAFLTAWGSATHVPSGWISNAGPSGVGSGANVGPDNQTGYSGYQFNAETGDRLARFRYYNTLLGRWIQRDPAGYLDSTNHYEYVSSMPTHYLDSFGLASDNQWDNVPGWKGKQKGTWHHRYKTRRVCIFWKSTEYVGTTFTPDGEELDDYGQSEYQRDVGGQLDNCAGQVKDVVSDGCQLASIGFMLLLPGPEDAVFGTLVFLKGAERIYKGVSGWIKVIRRSDGGVDKVELTAKQSADIDKMISQGKLKDAQKAADEKKKSVKCKPKDECDKTNGAEHVKNARASTEQKHQEGQARKRRDQPGGEKGDARRKQR